MAEGLFKPINEIEILSRFLEDDGRFPNNPEVPLLVFREVFRLPELCSPEALEEVFGANGWPPAWRNGVYPFHHYHSTAHETLGVYSGNAVIMLGGDNGLEAEVYAGDVILIPAGVAHRRIHSGGGFSLVGAYPAGQHPDMQYGKESERPAVLESISRVPLPAKDPVYGEVLSELG